MSAVSAWIQSNYAMLVVIGLLLIFAMLAKIETTLQFVLAELRKR